MKTLKILVSSNGWEYHGPVTLTYKDIYETTQSNQDSYFKDSEGNPAPNQVILDGIYTITFDEGFEVSE
tara:strand:+ start:150 stop:356 length:207 start_codon:yes stop_codon:yes gene_type:complete